ncbi:dynein regulatory complex protein 9 isoform X2 [Melanerpes formicivorus]|uniref:dynein regulatory complex protein 9 isoform X2 n=1 Tax=Melanerpes formicivorus TaxID=211600 RepID=UPI00358EB1A0
MEKFTHLEALLFTAVLENCVDQLSILGYIMPVSDEGKTDINNGDIQKIIETQEELDTNYQECMSARQGSGETVTSMSQKSIGHKQHLEKTEDLRSTHPLPNRAIKHRDPSTEILRKIQADRQYATDVITVTMKKMQESGTFNSLAKANEREKAKKSKFHDLLIRAEEGKREIKSLEKQLQDVKKETEIELQNRDDMIANLKDELQEMKAKTDRESSYAKKSTDVQVHQTQKKCSNTENILEKEIQKLEEKLKYWMDKYQKDTDAKDEELDALKASKANNLEILQRLAEECQMFEATIISDRAEKEARRKQAERDALELKSTLKLQAWWRGTMVRRYLGHYQALRMFLEKRRRQRAAENEKGQQGKSGAKKKPR